MTLDTVLASVFGPQSRPLRPQDGPNTIAGWDSLKQVELVVALEETFGIELATSDILALTSVGAIVAVLRKHGVHIGLATARV